MEVVGSSPTSITFGTSTAMSAVAEVRPTKSSAPAQDKLDLPLPKDETKIITLEELHSFFIKIPLTDHRAGGFSHIELWNRGLVHYVIDRGVRDHFVIMELLETAYYTAITNMMSGKWKYVHPKLIYTMLYFDCLDYFDKQKLKRKNAGIEILDYEYSEEGSVALAHELFDSEEYELLIFALSALAKDEKASVVLHTGLLFYIAGFSYKEIAHFAEVSPKAIESRVTRFRDAVKAVISGERVFQ